MIEVSSRPLVLGLKRFLSRICVEWVDGLAVSTTLEGRIICLTNGAIVRNAKSWFYSMQRSLASYKGDIKIAMGC